jgi:hypothetical protein
LWDVEVPTFSRYSAHRWRWGCQPYAPSARSLSPGRFLVLISPRGSRDPRAILRLEGLGLVCTRMDLRETSYVEGSWIEAAQVESNKSRALCYQTVIVCQKLL